MTKNTSKHGIGTLLNHTGEHGHHLRAHVMPIYQTTTFTFDSVKSATDAFTFADRDSYVYTRGRNPNSIHLAQKIARLEGYDLIAENPDKDPEEIAGAYITASGMGAITAAAFSRLKAGDTALVQSSIYGGSHKFWSEVAPRYGIHVEFVNSFQAGEWEKAFLKTPEAKVIYIESPANPTMELQDIQKLADLAHENDAWLIVDNTFATPYHQRPLTFGADLVVHSSTKYLGGHGVVTGGAIASRHASYVSYFGELGQLATEFGATASPSDSWQVNLGLKTLELRMERHSSNAMAIAKFMQSHPKVKTVLYPGLTDNPYHELAKKQMHNGFGGLVSFELTGGQEQAKKLLDSLTIPTIAISLGMTDSLIQIPALMTHHTMPRQEREAAGITEGLIRLSVGIENIEDLLLDLEQALDAS